MGYSAFKELFGEYEEEVSKPREKKVVKKTKKQKRANRLNFFYGFVISVIVVSAAFIITYFLSSNNQNNAPLQPVSFAPEYSDEIVIENTLDKFILKFINSSYRVDDFGAFGYIYEEIEDDIGVKKDGMISLGEGVSEYEDYTYFKNGRIVLLDVDENFKVVWGEMGNKIILDKENKEYFFVTEKSDFYYRRYLGQHILQDFVDDYLRNKEFITKIDENVWSWEWNFYTPVDSTRYAMNAEITLNSETEFVEQIKLLSDGEEIGVFGFIFEDINDISHTKFLDGYSRVNQEGVSSE